MSEGARITAACVIIPARNEEHSIAACIASVIAAAAHTGLPVMVFVVCDGCTDRTAAVARAALEPKRGIVVEGTFNSVGRARAEGALLARKLCDIAPLASQWYAFTDADTRVPIDWLSAQIRHADSGAEAVLGTIELDPADLPPALLACFEARYAMKVDADAHEHVHGANFGVRADQYWLAGGFKPWTAHEDRQLVRDLELCRSRIVRDVASPVVTSGRRHGRVEHGVSADLQRLSAELAG